VPVADALVITGAFKGTPTCIPPPVIATPAPNEIAMYLIPYGVFIEFIS
jgi:hypothetical protein